MDFWNSGLLRSTEEMQMLAEMSSDAGKLLDMPDVDLFSSREQFMDMLDRGGVFRHLIKTYQRKKDHKHMILLGSAALQLGLRVSDDHMKAIRTALEQTVMEEEKQEELRRLFGKDVTPEQCESETKESNEKEVMRRRGAAAFTNQLAFAHIPLHMMASAKAQEMKLRAEREHREKVAAAKNYMFTDLGGYLDNSNFK